MMNWNHLWMKDCDNAKEKIDRSKNNMPKHNFLTPQKSQIQSLFQKLPKHIQKKLKIYFCYI